MSLGIFFGGWEVEGWDRGWEITDPPVRRWSQDRKGVEVKLIQGGAHTKGEMPPSYTSRPSLRTFCKAFLPLGLSFPIYTKRIFI